MNRRREHAQLIAAVVRDAVRIESQRDVLHLPGPNARFFSAGTGASGTRAKDKAAAWGVQAQPSALETDSHREKALVAIFSLDGRLPAATNRLDMHESPANDDANLVASTLAGDRECFGRLYDRYARLVRAVVRPSAMDDATMHDMVQDCFLRAYRGLDRLREPEKFGPWLVGIARQVASECRRKRRRDRHQFVGAEVLDADDASDPAGWRERADELRVVLDELARLPERERLAIHTFFLQERGVAETARLLNLSRSGAYELVARACRRLAERLRPRIRTEEVKP